MGGIATGSFQPRLPTGSPLVVSGRNHLTPVSCAAGVAYAAWSLIISQQVRFGRSLLGLPGSIFNYRPGSESGRDVSLLLWITVGTGGRGGAPDTADIKDGDAIPLQLGEVHSVWRTRVVSRSSFLIVGLSRDAIARDDVAPRAFPGRGCRGN